MDRFGHANFAAEFLDFEFGKQLSQMRNERRRIQCFSIGIVAGESDGQFFARAGAGDVTVVTFARQPFAQIGAERDAALFQFIAVGVRQNRRRGGRGGKDGFVDAEHEREFQVRIARAVNGADQHLVEHGRNHADGQVCQAGLQDGQPVAQWQCRVAG